MAKPHPEQVAIRFIEAATPHHRREAADRCHLLPYHRREALVGEAFSILGLAPSPAPVRVRRARALAALAQHPHVAEVRPVFQRGRTRWLSTNRLLLKARANGGAEIERLVRRGATVVDDRHGTVLLELAPKQNLDATVRRLARLDSIEFAEPDFVVLGHHHGGNSAGSRLALGQTPLRLIGAAEGWKAGVASRNVIIAVLDCGVLTAHPDLKAAIGPTYDATRGRRDQTPKPWDSHGTSCAGLAAGTHAGQAGVKGVADGCALMPVRVAITPTRMGAFVSKTSWQCRGIDWAWEHGADVLSMSFGGGPRSTAVIAALQRARTKGRGGKGAVLIASAGNGDSTRTPVEFPATLSWVLAVSATDNQDRPKSAPDNQEPWVSASGTAVDLAAPGVGCYTTTVPDLTEGETALYTNDFSGTSASTPLVAGAAALVVGANAALSERDVRAILCSTADKVRTVKYTRGRNDWVGWGRLNVGAAVRAALAFTRS